MRVVLPPVTDEGFHSRFQHPFIVIKESKLFAVRRILEQRRGASMERTQLIQQLVNIFQPLLSLCLELPIYRSA